MGETVKEKVLKQCRLAMFSNIPVVFIKTTSKFFIDDLLLDISSPLVTPVKINDDSIVPITDASEFKWNNKNNYHLCESGMSGKIENLKYPCLICCTSNVQPDSVKKYIEDYEESSNEFVKSSILVLYGAGLSDEYPENLRNYTEIIDVDVPDKDEMKQIIIRSTKDYPLVFDDKFVETLTNRMMGFGLEETKICMRQVLTAVAVENGMNDADNIEKMQRAAQKAVSNRKKKKTEGGLLELCESDGKIGGMQRLKDYLTDHLQKPIKDYDSYETYLGVLPPKGILLCGVPGCGKSEAAKFTASTLDLPMLKMDIGSLMDKLQGNSERFMREALKLAEVVSPCVLWIDELEKGFSDSASGAGDSNSGVFKRMFAYLLGWMQDNRKPVFVFATANNIGGLPKELFRSGRFDALYGVYLPTADECADIFLKSMERCSDNHSCGKALFDKDFFDISSEEKQKNLKKKFKEWINKNLVIDKIPRIIIGSDIQKLVDITLRNIPKVQEITDLTTIGNIDQNTWFETLTSSLNEGTVFQAYGDSSENISSIAINYCRMMRKGFIPTSKDPLFDYHDYHTENYQKAKEDKNTLPILTKNNKKFSETYDRAVYDFLYEKINDVAVYVEEIERAELLKH